MASFVSSPIEVIWIFLKKGVYKLTFEGFILSNFFFVAISPLRGYFCKIMCNGQQAELNFNLLPHPAVAGCDISGLHQRAVFHVPFP